SLAALGFALRLEDMVVGHQQTWRDQEACAITDQASCLVADRDAADGLGRRESELEVVDVQEIVCVEDSLYVDAGAFLAFRERLGDPQRGGLLIGVGNRARMVEPAGELPRVEVEPALTVVDQAGVNKHRHILLEVGRAPLKEETDTACGFTSVLSQIGHED